MVIVIEFLKTIFGPTISSWSRFLLPEIILTPNFLRYHFSLSPSHPIQRQAEEESNNYQTEQEELGSAEAKLELDDLHAPSTRGQW